VMKLPISRWQRDLTDSTVLRNIGVAIAHTLLAYQSTCRGLNKVTIDVENIENDLNHHWEILAEPIQTILRRHGIPEAYEKLKDFTRGHKITKDSLHAFIANLNVSDAIKQEMYKLTPNHYVGYAPDLAKRI
jgi:adenylosuccinate lyase